MTLITRTLHSAQLTNTHNFQNINFIQLYLIFLNHRYKHTSILHIHNEIFSSRGSILYQFKCLYFRGTETYDDFWAFLKKFCEFQGKKARKQQPGNFWFPYLWKFSLLNIIINLETILGLDQITKWLNLLLHSMKWLIYTAGGGLGCGFAVRFLSYTEIGSRDPSPSLYNGNSFWIRVCIGVHLRHCN